jgi:NAD(P)H dehydrogenase (quinone)
MTIAITGATGQLGRLAVAELKTRVPAGELVALVRDPAKAADLGIAARSFDYTDTTDGLAAALAGVDVFVLISSNDFNDRAGQHLNAITAAKAAGIGRIVYTSILHADTTPMLIAGDHKVTEAALQASGIAHTVLRNGWYTENFAGGFAHALESGTLIGATGTGRISGAARADFAAAIAVTASMQGHEGQTYELAGDTAFTLDDLAAELTRVAGKPVTFSSLPEEVYAGILAQVGLPAHFARILADAEARAAEGALLDDSSTLSRLIGRPTTPMAETVRALLTA